MKSICKNIAFSKTGECLLGDKCICNANKLWLDEDPDPSPTKEGEEERKDEPLYPHMENIKFMKAFYGHYKTYVECHPTDKGAFQVEGKWITELDIKPGADWQVRRMKLAIIDYLMDQNIGMEFINKFKKWLFEHKFSTNE